MTIRRVCVFCGSRPGLRPEYMKTAATLGRLLAERGIGVVYGGVTVGTMGALADAALALNGEVIGIVPDVFSERRIAHAGLSELIIVDSMLTRKARMVELSDAFVALPGGAGTLDELFEVFTWAQLGFHQKPCALVNTSGYYDSLLKFLERALSDGFLAPEYRDLLLVARDPDEVLRLLHD